MLLKKLEFKKGYFSINLSDVDVELHKLISMWSKVSEKYTEVLTKCNLDAIDKRLGISKLHPFMFINRVDEIININTDAMILIIDDKNQDTSVSTATEDMYNEIEKYMKAFFANRISYQFIKKFRFLQNNHTMIITTRNIDSIYDKKESKKFNNQVSNAVKLADSRYNNNGNFICDIINNTSQSCDFSNFRIMSGDASNILERVLYYAMINNDDKFIKYVIVSHINGEQESFKRGNYIPYSFIEMLYKMCKRLEGRYIRGEMGIDIQFYLYMYLKDDQKIIGGK